MENNNNMSDEKTRSIFSELLHRRVPHVLGSYLAGSWIFLEFLDSIIGRHNLSPHWADITLVIIGLLFPTVIMLAYRHGAPGHQSWTKVEKIGIPSNVIVLVLALYNGFADKDMSSRAETIEAMSPDGTVMQVVRAKSEYRKRVFVGFYRLNTPNIDSSMTLGLSVAQQMDLEQDPFLNSYHALSYTRPLREADFTDGTAPFALMLKIARENRQEYYINGSLNEAGNNQFTLVTNIYRVKDGALIQTLTSKPHYSVFNAVDETTPQIKMAVGLNETFIQQYTDLPIEEQLTSNFDAYTKFIQGRILNQLKNEFKKAEALLVESIEMDPTFAIAISDYATALLGQSRLDEGLAALKDASKHSYRLHISQKFALNTIGHIYGGQIEKARAVLEQWLSLYPESIDAWQLKANLHGVLNEREGAIVAYRKLLELEPYGIHRHLRIGEMYTSLGDLESAIESYNEYIELDPTNARAHILLGDTYRRLGNFEQSNQEYVQAQVLMTNDQTASRRLIENLKRQGEFQEAERRYLNLLEETATPLTQYEIIRELGVLYLETGQHLKALDLYERGYDLLETLAPENAVLLTKMQDTWLFARAGEFERGQAILDETKEAMVRYDNDLYRANLLLAEARYNIFKDTAENSIEMIDQANETVKKYVGDGNDHIFEMMRGFAYYQADKFQDAIAPFKSFLQTNPTFDVSIWFALADAYIETGKHDEAMEIYDTQLKEYPAFPAAHYGMARIAAENDDNDSALSALATALKGWVNADENYRWKKAAETLKSQLQANGI